MIEMIHKNFEWQYSKDKQKRYRWRTVNWRGYLQLYIDSQVLVTKTVWSDITINQLHIPPELWFDIQGMKIPKFPLEKLPVEF